MTIKILTLFPKMFDALRDGVTGRAIESGLADIRLYDIRDYSENKHKKCDDTPFGGGAGMVMTPGPVYNAVAAADPFHSALRIYLSPKGERLTTAYARALAAESRDLLFLCGRYEGVDQRVLDMCFDAEISIGDYILTGGELAAMVVCDALLRFVPGVLGSPESAEDESFSGSDGLLEYPQYTRPFEFLGEKVPEILLSGHHENIAGWRREQSELITRRRRDSAIGASADAVKADKTGAENTAARGADTACAEKIHKGVKGGKRGD
ncbi:MAG: tRNA (guanosine(37)-N1)-methyltransferase TrmD [Clostridiales bacterium]|jgi:tRNA (guanine37-N1)-methyltransferase|nr:tRNA (guanosine(37)-N1)-methyltransferase TrmD [Clostridiales bacterium]